MSGFKDHFSGHAQAYAASRPGYPDALFDWLAEHAPGRGMAWEAGCGSGQATVALAARFSRVHASDPSAEQIARAPALPGVVFTVAGAEDCSLPDAGCDLVAVAQALHWFDLPRFWPQVQRVLRPGGLFAAWTYGLCSVSPAVDAVFHRLYEDRLGPYWPPERRLVEAGYRDIAMPLAPVPAPAFAIRLDWTQAQYLAYLRSWSAHARCLRETGVDAVSTLQADFAAAWGDAATRTVVWPLAVLAGRRP